MACEHEFYYYPETNEAGWRCSACKFKPGEPAGFSPELDRSRTDMKVMSMLMDLTEQDLVSVSNGEHGEAIALAVTKRCHAAKRFDQYSILLFILELMTERHARYWADVSDAIVAGKDKRDRCHCGKLVKVWQGTAKACGFEHLPGGNSGEPF
jgi:hypothetical protein